MIRALIPIIGIALIGLVLFLVVNPLEKKFEPPDIFSNETFKKVLGWFLIGFSILLTIVYIKFLPFLLKILVVFLDYAVIVLVKNTFLKK